MRFFSLILSVLLLSGFLSAQKKYLISPNDEAIPIEPGSNSARLMKQWENRQLSSQSGACADKFTFGYDPVNYPVTINFGARHKDVMGEWFEAKASGTIDTIFWQHLGDLGATDSTIYIRVHTSNLSSSQGPGIRPGPYNPPCQNWGYWVNTDDLDQGVAAFIEESTDPDWVSTINGSPIPAFVPFAEERWGFGGFPKIGKIDTINYVPMSDLGDTIGITVGEAFFVSMRVAHPAVPPSGHREDSEEARSEWATAGFIVSTDDEDYPSRNWKFYEHDKGPSNCAGFPLDSIKRGWVARGGFGIDTLDVGMFNFWYSMTVTSNVPPTIANQTEVGTTFDTGPQVLQAEITDCNPAQPGNAGIASAVIRYSVDNVFEPDVVLSEIGGDVWEGDIPGQSIGSVISYKIIATDLDGAVSQGPPGTYTIVPFGTEWYGLDTGVVCVKYDISGSGTKIDTADYFLPSSGTTSVAPKDDGTAGPFDMGGDFVLFGDEFRYAWVGVNGAIALSKSATDTLDVNSNGFFTGGWNFPQTQKNGRGDTARAAFMPPMMISAFWNDLIVGDSLEYGAIRYGDDGDSCKFIVEYDSVGTFAITGPEPDITTFRIVLNRCSGVVEFQYNSVGTTGLEETALVGMQADSNATSGSVPGYAFLNDGGFPLATRPRDNYCVKIHPRIGVGAIEGWNMVAVSMVPNNANYAKAALFPTASSPAYEYSSGYTTADPLSMGKGYWLKFDQSGGIGASNASFDHTVSAPVNNAWNIIGGPSGFVATGSIVPSGVAVSSSYFGYGSAGYFTATTLWPGYGYWVKVTGTGTLDMSSAGAAPKAAPVAGIGSELESMNRLVIYDGAGRTQTLYLADESRLRNELSYYEMPPVPPAGGFDVRYGSHRYLESYPSELKEGASYEYPIAIQGAVYPLALRWEISSPVSGSRKMVLSTADGKTVVMEGSGATVVSSAGGKGVVVKLSDDVTLPAEFALSQNYPNPFNPVTHFEVDIAGTSEVDVTVYDLLGRKIATLLKGTREAGSYTVEWDGRDGNGFSVPTGMYLVRMTADDFSTARKIMLMK